jgi:hypothetical protein
MAPRERSSKKALLTQKPKGTTGKFVRVTKAPKRTPGRTEVVRHAARGERLKTKVSIAISPDVLDWANGQAKQRALSLSAVFSTALEKARRDEAFDKALEAVGGTADITEQDLESVYAEWRAHGLID